MKNAKFSSKKESRIENKEANNPQMKLIYNNPKWDKIKCCFSCGNKNLSIKPILDASKKIIGRYKVCRSCETWIVEQRNEKIEWGINIEAKSAEEYVKPKIKD